MKTCPKCGSMQNDDAVFCNKCASPFADGSVPAAPQQLPGNSAAKIPAGTAAAATEEKKIKKPIIIFAAVFLAVIAFAVLLYHLFYGRYNSKAALQDANANAKLAFVAASDTLSDMMANGKRAERIEYQGPVDRLPNGEITNAIKDEFKNAGIDGGYIYIYLIPDDDVYYDQTKSFIQWSPKQKDAVIGQYPNPPATTKESKLITFGSFAY